MAIRLCPSLDQRRAGQVVGMDMGFKDPFKRHASASAAASSLPTESSSTVPAATSKSSTGSIATPRRDPVPDQIADRIGRLVEEGADLRFDTHSTLLCFRGPPSL